MARAAWSVYTRKGCRVCVRRRLSTDISPLDGKTVLLAERTEKLGAGRKGEREGNVIAGGTRRGSHGAKKKMSS